MGEVERRPADLMAASSSSFDGSLTGTLRAEESWGAEGLPHLAAAFLTDAMPSWFSLFSPSSAPVTRAGPAEVSVRADVSGVVTLGPEAFILVGD